MPLAGEQLLTAGTHRFKWAQMWRGLAQCAALRLLGPFSLMWNILNVPNSSSDGMFTDMGGGGG